MKQIKIKVYVPVTAQFAILDIEHPQDFRQREIDDLVEREIKEFLYNAISFTITELSNE